MPEKSLLVANLKQDTQQKKSLRNHALDEYNATRKGKLLQAPVTSSKVCTNKSLTRTVTTDTSEVTEIVPLENWLIHSTNADSKERCHLWNWQDGLITLFMSKSKTLFFKQIPITSIKEVKLLKNGAKLKVKLNNGLVMTVSTSSKSRSFAVLKLWFAKLDQASCGQDDLENTAVTDNKSTEQAVGIFNNIQFALDFGNTSSDKEDLRNLIKKNGGQISYIFTKNTKYFVCGAQKDFYKSQRALKLGIPIVAKDFLKECVAKGKLLPTPKSDEDAKAAQDEFAKGKISISVEEKNDEDAKEFCIDTLKEYKLDDAECPEYTEDYHVVKFAFLTLDDAASLVCIEAHTAAGMLDHLEYGYRVMISVRLNNEKTRRFFYFVDDAHRLCQCYEAVVMLYIEDWWQRQVDIMEIENIGDVSSEKLSSLLEEMKISKGSLNHNVERLVGSIWHDSLGELAKCDIVPEDVTLHDVCNAMIALLKIEQALRDNSDVQHLSKEYYKHIRRKNMKIIDTIQAAAKEREICQILKDVVCVKENLWNTKNIPSSILQYSALNCVIRHVDKAHSEFKSVLDLFPSKNEIKYDIINVYRVNRTVEDIEFCADIKNRKLLFHSSASGNTVSILSRGLIMPSKACDELGIPRSDEGFLGHGIYFSDSFAMSSKYTNVSSSRGSRLMFIHEVALGDVFKTEKRMSQLRAPPSGFHSVMGVNLGDDSRSGNEFVVYNVNQQRMRYLVEFTLNEENVDLNADIGPLSIFKQPKNLPVPETPEYSEPALKQVEFGLVSSKKDSVNLEEFHVRGKIVDLVAEVTVFQVYRNNFNSNIEGKYVFPLEENVAVCGFEAYINEKHVIGEVKEKEQARKEYKKAVAEGHGAYLMEEEEPSVFSLSLGNIPAHAKVVIKIKYVCELETVSDPDCCVLFSLPKNLADWKQDSTLIDGLPTQGKTDSVKVAQNAKKTSFMISIDMPYDIHEIKSPTHCISWKKTATKACVKLSKSASLFEKNLRLLIRVAEIHVPRIWVEQNDEMSSSEVAMVTFFPEFDFNAREDYQCTILLDMSYSMNGKPCSYAKYIAKSIINALSSKSKFNVIMFGSYFKELFAAYEHASDNMKQKALEMLNQCEPNLGGSDLTHIFGSLYLLLNLAEKHNLHNVFLVSDGHLADEDRILRMASKISTASSSQTRFFSYAVGDTPNKHFLQKICTISGGRFEHFLPTIKHTWSGQIENQLRYAKQPVLTDVHIDWCNYEVDNNDASIFTNVPEKPKCIFSGSRMTAYSFLPNCSKATLHACIMGTEVSTVVTVNSLNKITGKTLHYLAAKAVFNEYDTGNLADDAFVNQIYHEEKKSFITSLSIKHSVVCKFTSFIAVEKREPDEDMSITTGPTMEELLKPSFIDEIPEVSWEGVELTVQDKIDELLKCSKQNESSSILQAREFAQDAAKLCEKLSDEPLKKMLVSATCFRLGIEYYGLSPKQVLDQVVLKNRSPNLEIVDEIIKSDDPSYSKALEELVRLSWSSEDTLQLMSIARSLRPVIISAFEFAFRDVPIVPPFWDDIQSEFWRYMRNIDEEQDYMDIKRLVVRGSLRLLERSSREFRPKMTKRYKGARMRSGTPSTEFKYTCYDGVASRCRRSASVAPPVPPTAPASFVSGETDYRGSDLLLAYRSTRSARGNRDKMSPSIAQQSSMPSIGSRLLASSASDWRKSAQPARPGKGDSHVKNSALHQSQDNVDDKINFLSAQTIQSFLPMRSSVVSSIIERRKNRILESSGIVPAAAVSRSYLESQSDTPSPPSVPPRDVSSDANLFIKNEYQSALPSLASDMVYPTPAFSRSGRSRPPPRLAPDAAHIGIMASGAPPVSHQGFSSAPPRAHTAPPLPGGNAEGSSSPPRQSVLENLEQNLENEKLERSAIPELELCNFAAPPAMERKRKKSVLSRLGLGALTHEMKTHTGQPPARTTSGDDAIRREIVPIAKIDEYVSASSSPYALATENPPANIEMSYVPTEAYPKGETQAKFAFYRGDIRGSKGYGSANVTKRIKGKGTVSAHVVSDLEEVKDDHVSKPPPPLSSKEVAGKFSHTPVRGTLFGSAAPPRLTKSAMSCDSSDKLIVESEKRTSLLTGPKQKIADLMDDIDEVAQSSIDSISQDIKTDLKELLCSVSPTSHYSQLSGPQCYSSSHFLVPSQRSKQDGVGQTMSAALPTSTVQQLQQSLHSLKSCTSNLEVSESASTSDQSLSSDWECARLEAYRPSPKKQGSDWSVEEFLECETYDDVEPMDQFFSSSLGESDEDMGFIIQSSPFDEKIHITSVARLAAELQKTDPVGGFQPDDERIHHTPTKDLIMSTVEKVLAEAGAKSLGERCFSECVQMLFLSVAIILWDHMYKEDAELHELATVEAWKSQVKLSNDKYPLLYDRLELGKSWNEAAHFIIELVCKKLPKHTPRERDRFI